MLSLKKAFQFPITHEFLIITQHPPSSHPRWEVPAPFLSQGHMSLHCDFAFHPNQNISSERTNLVPDTSGPLKRLHSVYTQRAFICAQTVYDFCWTKSLLLVSSWINPEPDFLMSWGESKVRRELEILHHLGKTTSLVPQAITALEQITGIQFLQILEVLHE